MEGTLILDLKQLAEVEQIPLDHMQRDLQIQEPNTGQEPRLGQDQLLDLRQDQLRDLHQDQLLVLCQDQCLDLLRNLHLDLQQDLHLLIEVVVDDQVAVEASAVEAVEDSNKAVI